MKKFIVLSCSMLLLFSCKNDVQEADSEDLQFRGIPASNLDQRKNTVLNDTVSVNESRLEVAHPNLKNDAVIKSISKTDYASFGAEFSPSAVINREQMLKKYQNLKAGDTISVAFQSTINEVCKKKGCWMDVSLGKSQKSFVKFKDYAFFVPMNADNSEAIIKGKAFVEEVSVAQLKHYAKDGGKSQEEIDQIIEPKITYAFQADGVLIKR